MSDANRRAASAFAELADLLELAGAERFKILAYRRAAETLETLGRDVSKLSERELRGLRGVGGAIASKLRELLETGTIAKLEEAREAVPPGLRDLTQISGLGPKKALLLHQELGIESVEDLRTAVETQQVRTVKGLGPKTEENLSRALRAAEKGDKRALLDIALATAEDLLTALRSHPAVKRAAYAGSLRRMKETIGDIDLLVTTDDAASVMELFTSLQTSKAVAARGGTKSSIVTPAGLQVDLRAVKDSEFGAAMQYFTGSQSHNVKVREHAVKKGMKLSEYGVFKVAGNELIAGATEEEVYAALGMQTPLPTMREDRGEVELALRGELPEVLELSDIRGDLHCHSDYSDGRASIEEMALTAAELGYEYIAITDHGRNIHVKSLSLDDIRRQSMEIDRINESLGGSIRVLHGVELNIGADGEVDYPDDVLALFEVVVASVHHSLSMDRHRMTQRIVRALQNPRVNIFGHPTARRIGRRLPIEFDLETVFEVAAKNGVALEINSNPQRIDLRDEHARLAREFGCKFSIDSDAHTVDRLAGMRLGVGTAQRAWVSAGEVINAMPLDDLRRFLGKTA